MTPAATRRARRLLRAVEFGCWALGTVAATLFVLNLLQAYFFQVSQAERLEQIVRQSHEGEAPRQSAVKRAALRVGQPFGRISIPRIGLSAMIAEGVDEATLRKAVGHIPGTPVPENGGNVALAGHRDTFFRELRHVRVNDLVELETPRGVYFYEVVTTQVVAPQDTKVLQPEAANLTLVTCFPFRYVGPAPERFVVQARRLQ
jgi:sortase A